MSQTDRPISNPIVVLREEFDDWAILFNPDTAAAVGINPVGVSIWNRMDGKRTIKEIIQEIATSFEAAPDTAHEEINIFVDTLAEQGYVGYELRANSRGLNN
jgi:SynChlorMet cassette protein ScmD